MNFENNNYLNIYPENISGNYFVTDECIACDTCTDISQTHFKLTEDYDHAYVCVQPTLPDEINSCNEALEACPVGAIQKKS
jgi:ferredoxin